MSAPGSAPSTSPDAALRVFTESGHSATPMTTEEVGDELGCPPQDTQTVLENLRERGALQSKTVAAQTRIWWLSDPGETDDQFFDHALSDGTTLSERILEIVPVDISIVSSDGELVSANSRALDRLDLQESQLAHHTVESWDLYDEEGELIHFEDAPWADITETGETVREYECQVDLPEIGRRWLSINASPLHGAGEKDYILFAIDDITDQKEHERQLRRERNQTRELLRTAPIAISVRDDEGNTVMANERAQEILGLSEQEIIDNPKAIDEWRIYDADGGEISPEETPSAQVHATEDPVFDQEIAIENPDGKRMWFSLSAAPVFDADGDLDRVITTGEEITELKRREQQLEHRKAELETELSEILGRISDAFYALNDEWQFSHVNNRAEELLQRSREELLDEKLWDVFPEVVETEIWERFRTAMETTEPVSFEYEYEELDIWLEINAYPSESGLSVYFQDVTSRKAHEQELERYRTIVEAVDDGIYTVDPDGHFTMVNDAYAEMTGYSREELLGSHVSLVVDDEIVDQASDREADLVTGEQDQAVVEAEVKRADGGTVPAEAKFALFSSGDSYERIGVVRDITDRKEDQRKLEESERRYRTLAENFPNGAVGLYNEALEYTAVGGQLLDATGVDPEDRIGSSVYEIYPEELIDEIEPYFHAALDGEANSFEAEFHDRHLLAHTLPVRNAAGAVFAGMLVVQDITEQREYERKLEESNERLEQFAYIASHDLQEPLRMISSYLQLLEEQYRDDLDADAAEFIEFAVDGADRMQTMVDALLAYSRLDTDAEPLEPTDPETVVDTVREQLQLQIEENNAAVIVEDLPVVAADANQLEQVFQNLISNAIKYRDEAPPRIEINAERQGDMCRFHISDNGIGIDPAYTEQIFEVFKRLHSHKDYPGTGIGLALCQKIVERHGGEIWVESEPGEGSTFSFTIPLENHQVG